MHPFFLEWRFYWNIKKNWRRRHNQIRIISVDSAYLHIWKLPPFQKKLRVNEESVKMTCSSLHNYSQRKNLIPTKFPALRILYYLNKKNVKRKLKKEEEKKKTFEILIWNRFQSYPHFPFLFSINLKKKKK